MGNARLTKTPINGYIVAIVLLLVICILAFIAIVQNSIEYASKIEFYEREDTPLVSETKEDLGELTPEEEEEELMVSVHLSDDVDDNVNNIARLNFGYEEEIGDEEEPEDLYKLPTSGNASFGQPPGETTPAGGKGRRKKKRKGKKKKRKTKKTDFMELPVGYEFGLEPVKKRKRVKRRARHYHIPEPEPYEYIAPLPEAPAPPPVRLSPALNYFSDDEDSPREDEEQRWMSRVALNMVGVGLEPLGPQSPMLSGPGDPRTGGTAGMVQFAPIKPYRRYQPSGLGGSPGRAESRIRFGGPVPGSPSQVG
jgi:hypothetical protein